MRLFPRTPMFVMALVPLALAGAVGQAAGAATATAAATGGCAGWNGAQPPAPATYSLLSDIAAVAACNVWAVGSQENSLSGLGSEQPLIEHWTGSSWATVPASGVTGALERVSAASASDIWAAGESADGTLILHYDGTSWTRKSTPHDNDGSVLDAVYARTANDAWAGGADDSGSGPAVLMHWDGTSWSTVNLPAAATPDRSEIVSVSADSATDVWALSQINGGGTSDLLHWDGSHWQSFTQSVGDGPMVKSITALSPASAWAVGMQSGGPDEHWQTLTEHWDGTRWSVVPSPDPGGTGQDNKLLAVTATSGSDVWAAGWTGDPFALHWNGSSWAAVSLPASGVQFTPFHLPSISVAAPGQAWISDELGVGTDETPFAAPVPVVPDVSGDTVDAATSALTAAGLTVSSTQNSTTTCAPSIPNHVASTDPAAGQQASFGQAVTLTVCGAVVINPTVTVPDVTGEDDATARSDITSAGLTVGTITLRVSCTIPRGQVISQTPAGGTTAPFGARINLTEATRSGAAAQQITPHACSQ